VLAKDVVYVKPGDFNILPSHMSGDVALVRATHKVTDSLESLSHGTGRAISRADCKPFAETYDYGSLRKRVMIPERVDNASLRTEGPFAYRDLDDCLKLLSGYVDLIERFAVIGYMGHL
jgi:RNA-splicing ligase RtcB